MDELESVVLEGAAPNMSSNLSFQAVKDGGDDLEMDLTQQLHACREELNSCYQDLLKEREEKKRLSEENARLLREKAELIKRFNISHTDNIIG